MFLNLLSQSPLRVVFVGQHLGYNFAFSHDVVIDKAL